MFYGRLVLVGGLTMAALLSHPRVGAAQEPAATPRFQSAVDMVRVSTTVRDRKGRFVVNLSAHDFEVLDDGQARPVEDLREERAGLSIAILFDVSGSMENGFTHAREAAIHLLSWLEPADEVAVFTFDTRLDEVTPFTMGLRTLPESVATTVPFGATSLHDAIARTARQVGIREGRRTALVVFTDGSDNASRLTPSEVSGIASSIDVPVYIFGVALAIDNPETEFSTVGEHSSLAGPLNELAIWTGGRVFVASTPAARSAAAHQIVEELRHLYVIAFESSGKPGWHPLVVRAHGKDLTVRARSGYFAGQSRPNSD
jgi:Ca-activated chloride channel family protein